MSENETNGTNGKSKVEFEYHAPPIEDYNSTDYLVTRIGVGANITDEHQNRYDKFEIAFKRFKIEDFDTFEEALKALALARGIDAEPQAILDRLIATLFTAPDYHSVLCYQIGELGPDGVKIESKDSPHFKVLKPAGHEAAQTLADGFVVGQKAAGPSQKKLATEAKAAEAATGMSTSEMAQKILKLKEQGLLD
jgi:hypothetical protein